MSFSRMGLPSNAIATTPSPQPTPAPKPHVPRIATLIARISRPKKSLVAAARNEDPSGVCDILNDQTKAAWLDQKSLNLALCEVAGQGYERAVRLLLEKGADVDARGEGELDAPALAVAARVGHEQIVRLLLENGANINATGYDGPALVGASGNGHEEVVRLLLGKGANINASGGNKDTALDSARRNGHKQVMHLLLEYGAQPHGWERQRIRDRL